MLAEDSFPTSKSHLFMTVPKVDSDKVRPLFGGCNKLYAQYRNVGWELCAYEERMGTFKAIVDSNFLRHLNRLRKGACDSCPAFEAFKVGVAFIPDEVLDSYLEDLLSLKVSESKLFIEQKTNLPLILNCVSYLGLLCALALGLFAVSAGVSVLYAFALSVLVASPFGILWHVGPKYGVMRRMDFAQIISKELARRRGSDDLGTTPALESKVLQRFLGSKISDIPQGAARSLYH